MIDEYTRQQDIKNENTDGLSSRLEKLEVKADQMQEKINARLQQINELLEKAVQHRTVIKTGDS